MRHRHLAFALASLVTTIGAAANAADLPTAQQVIDKAVAAMGGDAIDRIASYHSISETTMPQGTMTTETFWAKPDRILLKRRIPQMGEMASGSNGTVAWSSVPVAGYALLSEEQAAELPKQAMHVRVLQLRDRLKEDFLMKGVRAVEFDGADCYGLEIVEKGEAADADRGTMFFDAETGLVRGFTMTSRGQESTLRMQDWKRVGDVRVFHRMTMDDRGTPLTMTFTTIEFGSVDPAVFALPDEVEKLAAQRGNTPKADGAMSLDDFSPQVQQMIKGMLDGLPWDDAAQLRAAREGIASGAARTPGEYGKAMSYLLEKIDARLAELGG